jgi:hypothetical protein
MSIIKKIRELLGKDYDEDDDFYDDFDYEDYCVNYNNSRKVSKIHRAKETEIPKATKEIKSNGLTENVQEKVIMNEMLSVNEYAEILEYALNEFKRTFSCPNKDIEIVFRKRINKSKGDEKYERDE